jgi:hypothetical protein
MEESTEGTPVKVSGASDFVEMQDDFNMSSAFENLESAAMRSSIGMSKIIQGAEQPTMSMSHYLKHSGVEGQAPQYNLLLKSLFGSETVEGTEYDTVAGSTTTVLNVDSGEGQNFGRGHVVLVKDGTNGYAIRPVHSVSTDALTLGFALSNAPASGVNLGKACMYEPANTGHPSLTLWNYLGNGGAIELMSGVKVTEMSVSFSASELINASFSMEGTNYKRDAILIDATNANIDFSDGSTQAAVVTQKTYKDPHELAAEIQSKMDAQSSDTITCTYSDDTGKFTIASDGVTFSLLWKTGADGSDNDDTHIGTVLGFSDTADDTGATSYTSDSAFDKSAPYTPSYDASDPVAAKNHLFYLGDQDDNVCFEPTNVDVTISNTRSQRRSICSESGISGSNITAREVTFNVTSYLDQHDVDKFRKFRENEDTRALYVFGEKSSGDWVAGKCGAIYGPSLTISSYNIADIDGLVSLELELKAYIDSDGNDEIYLGFV